MPAAAQAEDLASRISRGCRGLAATPRLAALAGLAQARDQGLWLVGGVLRDLALGLEPPDIDLAADGDAVELARVFARESGAVFVLLDRENAASRLVWPDAHLDLTGLRAPTLEGDLAARDFTINAMAYALHGEGRILDPTRGLADLAAMRLRPAGPGVLAADPLRVLRAYRFFSVLGMDIPPATAGRLSAAGPGLFRVAAQRIGEEWLKLMAGPGAGRAVAAMDRDGVLTRLVPELSRGKGFRQNRFHHLDVFRHSLETLRCLDRLAIDPAHGGLGDEAGQYLAEPGRAALLKSAALLHDLGKPAAAAPKPGGEEFTFYNHDQLGAALARDRCRALGLSKAAAKLVGGLTGLHMRPHQLAGVLARQGLSRRAARRLLQEAGEHLAGLFLLALADAMAGQGPDRPDRVEADLVEVFRQATAQRDAELARALAAPPLLDGNQVMAELGLQPGPEVGRILRALREAQLDGEIGAREEALAMAARLHGQKGD